MKCTLSVKKTKDGSRFNILSAFMCLRLAERNINKFEVGIITPYSAQSRLILAMIRDIQEKDKRWKTTTCATVHQFQGSEKPIVIYDAVDCYRMPYPGTLLTQLKNDTANRLFNVALSRAKGKFVLVANIDFLKIKKISKNLMFTKAIEYIEQEHGNIKGSDILKEVKPKTEEKLFAYIDDRLKSWDTFMQDISNAKNSIFIDFPDVMKDDSEKIDELSKILKQKNSSGVRIQIRSSEDIVLPISLNDYVKHNEYVMDPVTIIDEKITWFGQPIYDADFIGQNEIIETKYFPCVRFEGHYTARILKSFLEI